MTWATTLTEAIDDTAALVKIAAPIPVAARWPYRVVLEAGTPRAELAFLTGSSQDRLSYSIDRGSLGSDQFPHDVGASISRSFPSLTATAGTGGDHPDLAAHVLLGLAMAGVNVPAGVIVMWGGPVASIPAGWVLCDGQNGTPDLRDRFVKGTDGNPGAMAGSATHGHAVTQPSSHAALSHAGVTVGNHVVTQPAAHSDHVFTQPGAHAVTQPSAHADHAAQAHSAHAGATVASHAFTQPGAHTDHAALAHSAHAGATVGNHAFTQPGAHSNHVVTQPNAHADVLNHVHVEQLQGGTTGTTTGTHLMGSAAVGGSLRSAGQSTLNPTTGGVASQAHTGSAVDAHSAHSGGAVDAHAVGQSSAHTDHAALAHSAHSGGAVDAHSVGQASAHSDHAALAHGAHSGTAVDAHAGGGVNAHSAHAGTAVDPHTVGQANQHAIQAHSGAAVDTVSNEPPFYALCFIQKAA